MNTRRARRSFIACVAFVAVLSCVSINAQEERLPINLTVPKSLRPVLEKMMQRSPTFRHQIELLARRPGVRVNVSYGGLRNGRRYHALSTVRRHQFGAMVVQTTLYVPADVVEIMAHEMEHICEQIEGVDLRKLAAAKSAGVISFAGHFETLRAIQVGQQVAREVTGDIEESRIRLTKTY